jgi:hypothetical protein
VFSWLPEARDAMGRIADFIGTRAQPVQRELTQIPGNPAAVFAVSEMEAQRSG